MSKDTIYRKDAINAVYESSVGRQMLWGHKDLITTLKNLPSAEQERKNGEWIYGENGGQDGWFCSECEFFVPWYYEYYGLNNIDFIADFHTCPKCDSKMLKYTGMRGEQDERV